MARNTGQLCMKVEALKPIFLQFFLYLHLLGRFLQLAIFFFFWLAFHGTMGNQRISPSQPRNLPVSCNLHRSPQQSQPGTAVLCFQPRLCCARRRGKGTLGNLQHGSDSIVHRGQSLPRACGHLHFRAACSRVVHVRAHAGFFCSLQVCYCSFHLFHLAREQNVEG